MKWSWRVDWSRHVIDVGIIPCLVGDLKLNCTRWSGSLSKFLYMSKFLLDSMRTIRV